MNTIERNEFFQRYGISPSRVSKLKEGQCLNVKGNGCSNTANKVLKCEKIYGSKGNPAQIVLTEMPSICHPEPETFVLDLSTHWERGGSADFELCHEGVVNLIKGIYAQTEADYEALYIAGPEGIPLEKMPGENFKDFYKRLRQVYTQTYKSCEEFLGEVFCKYAKVRALYRINPDVNYIADKIGETPQHVACIVDRLGLNRTETPQNDMMFY